MVFRPELESSYSRHPITERDKQFVTQLYKNLYMAGRITRRPSQTQWARQFAILNKELKNDRKRIQTVLDWFCKHSRDRYTPVVYSARMFCEKFLQIEAAMKRSLDTPKPVKISRDAERLSKVMKTWHWPKGFSTHIPESVQRSLDNWVEFRTKLANAKPTNKGLVRFLLSSESSIPSTHNFILDWFQLAFDRVSDWDQWSRKPESIIFRSDSKQFRGTFLDWCEDYDYNRKRAIDLLEVINEQ